MDIGLRDRTALVLGSTSGLGLASARLLAEEGAHVVLAGRRGEVAREEADRLPSAIGIEVDLTQPDAVDRLVSAAAEHFGPVDVLVLNSGGPKPGLAESTTAEQAAEAMEFLLLQHIRLVRAVLPGMRERGWGRIVAIGSSGVQAPLANLALSNTGRGALAGYLKTLASEVAADGVTVNMVLPGRIATDRVASLDRVNAERNGSTPEQVQADAEANIPVKRYGTPEEFASAVVFLASRQASYVTGEQLRVDGGLARSY